MAIGSCVTIKPTVSIPTSSLLHRSSNRMNFKIRSFMFQQSGLLSFPVSTFNHTSSSRIIPILKPHKPNTTCVSFQRRCTREKFTETKTYDGDLGLWKHCASKMLFFLGPIKDTVFAITKATFAWVLLGFMSVLYGKRKPPEEVLFDQLIGLDDPVEKMKKILIHLRYAKANVQVIPRGVLLYGPDNIGKTTLAHALAHEAKYLILSTTALNIEGNDAETKLQNIFRDAKLNSPCVILMENIEALKEDISVDKLESLVNTCKREKADVFLIGTTKKLNMVHSKLLDNVFASRVKIEKPDREAREKMLSSLLEKVKADEKETCCREMAEKTDGFVWTRLECLCNLALIKAKYEYNGGEEVAVTLQHLNEALASMDWRNDL